MNSRHLSFYVQMPVLVVRYGYTVLPARLGLPVPTDMKQLRAARRLSSLLALLLSPTILVAVGGMLAWHTYLVLTAQGTIDFQQNREAAASAARCGHSWMNIHDLGMVRNWQERFDEKGRFWMLTWLLPRLSRHRGCGYELPMAPVALAYLNAQGNV